MILWPRKGQVGTREAQPKSHHSWKSLMPPQRSQALGKQEYIFVITKTLNTGP